VAPVFWAFRVMVGVGLLMLAGQLARLAGLRGAATSRVWMARVLVGMTFSGWVATLAGWYVTEIGRQPWLVYGVLRPRCRLRRAGAADRLTLTLYLLAVRGCCWWPMSRRCSISRARVRQTRRRQARRPGAHP
jgi:cytochrome d ubiquinol oxidase subunit I